MKYDLFLFDADDTLWDFQESERSALGKTLKSFDIKIPLNEALPVYKEESEKQWKLWEKGKVCKIQMRSDRFKNAMSRFDVERDFVSMSEKYLDCLPEEVHTMDGALDFCKLLKKQKKTIGIITNGIDVTQKRRMANCELRHYIDFMVTSEGSGFAKPDPRIFTHSQRYWPNTSKEKTVVIGDRIETDIRGAKAFGVDACWYNPKNWVHPDDQLADFAVKDFKEMPSLFV